MCCAYAFGGYSVSMRYILGFDGGGTKTECVLMNSADQVLARTYAGASNPSRIGVESAAAFGRNAEGEIARAGGYGPSSSDHGSAYDIGKRAIAAAIQERTSASDSALGRHILAQLRCTEWPVVQHRAQTMPDEIFPPIFPVIAAAADSGDATAQGILLSAAQAVSSLVADVADRLHLHETEFLLAKIGGTIGRSHFFDAQIDAALKQAVPSAQIGKLRISPAEAAALAAKEADAG